MEERAALDKRTEDSAAASRRLESKEADLAALQAEMDAVQAKFKLDLLEAQQGKEQREQLLATLQEDHAALKADTDEKAKAQVTRTRSPKPETRTPNPNPNPKP